MEIAVGDAHACARSQDGRAYCWGSNDASQLGRHLHGGQTQSVTPELVKNLPAVAQLALGKKHSCARTDAGAVYCWGSNAEGQGGHTTTPDSATPRRVEELPAAVDIVAGDAFTCARLANDDAWCWGHYQNPSFEQKRGWVSCIHCRVGHVRRYGRIGAKPSPRPSNYVDVIGRAYRRSSRPERIVIEPARSIAVTVDLACAASRKGRLTCHGLWTPANMTPKMPRALPAFTEFDVASWAGCGIRADNTVVCWTGGQRVWTALQGATDVKLGTTQACLRLANTELMCWDKETYAGDKATTANPVMTLSTVDSYDVSGKNACALSRGRIYCWGSHGILTRRDHATQSGDITDQQAVMQPMPVPFADR